MNLPGTMWRRSIGVQALALAGSTGIAQLIMAVLFILTARSTAPYEFGLVVAAIAIGTTAVGLLDFGTNSYWTRELASGRLKAAIVGPRLTSKLLFSAVALGTWSVATFLLAPSTSFWSVGPIAMSLLLNQSFQVPLRSLGRGDIVAAAVLLEKLAAAIIFILLTTAGTTSVSALWSCLSLASLLSAAFCWWHTPLTARLPLVFRWKTNPWTASSHYGVATAALTAQTLDIPILTMLGGASAAGVYGAVSKWTQPMSLLASAFSSAAAPHIARANSGKQAWQAAKKATWLLWVAMALCMFIAILSEQIVGVLIGANYAGAGPVLRVLAISTIFAIANQPLYVFLQSRGLDRPIAHITLASVLLQLALVVIFAASLKELGAAIAMLSTQIILLVSMSVLLAKKWQYLKRDDNFLAV